METLGMVIHNKFVFQLEDVSTKSIIQTAEAYNLVLDSFYSSFGTNYGTAYNFQVLWLGTSDTTPQTSDTAESLKDHMIADKDPDSDTLVFYKPADTDKSYVNARKLVYTFSENEANGSLKDVGICNTGIRSSYNRCMMSHALIKDSEGHAITIEKDNRTILHVTAYIYSKVTFSGTFQFIRQSAYSPVKELNPPFIYNDCSYSPLVDWSLGYRQSSTMGVELHTTSIPVIMNYLSDLSLNPGDVQWTNVSPGVLRITTPRIISTDGNASKTVQFRSLALISNSGRRGQTGPFAYLSFPNHTIYPPKTLTFNLVGDGQTTDFNLGVPLLMEGSNDVHVYIKNTATGQNVEVPSTDYDWSGRDYTTAQGWDNQDLAYWDTSTTVGSAGTPVPKSRMEVQDMGSNGYYRGIVPLPGICTTSLWGTQSGISEPGIYYDFGSPITVSSFKTFLSGWGQYQGYYKLDYKDSNGNWVTAASTATPRNSWDIPISPSITARYWRIYGVGDPTVMYIANKFYSEITDYFSFCFGNPRPQLRFHTAPANGVEITVEAKTEYPMKNDKWIVEPIVVDVSISKTPDV